MDCNDTIEDGEINFDESEKEEEEVGVYKINSRPEINTKNNLVNESDDESDSEKNLPVKRPVEQKPQQSKSGNLWKEMLQEEDLMENLKSCDVSTSRKRKIEVSRGVETYDLDIDTIENKKRKESSNEPRLIKKLNKNNKVKEILIPRKLPDLSTDDFSDDDEYAKKLSSNLHEDNVELILKVVSVIGKENAQKIYAETKDIEQKGGMLTLNKKRRRTSGGIFLYLVKSFDEINESQRKEIFSNKKEEQQVDVDISTKNDDEIVTKP